VWFCRECNSEGVSSRGFSFQAEPTRGAERESEERVEGDTCSFSSTSSGTAESPTSHCNLTKIRTHERRKNFQALRTDPRGRCRAMLAYPCHVPKENKAVLIMSCRGLLLTAVGQAVDCAGCVSSWSRYISKRLVRFQRAKNLEEQRTTICSRTVRILL